MIRAVLDTNVIVKGIKIIDPAGFLSVLAEERN